ncbi:MAG: hypothetical protein NW203_05875 [Hyphomonadaceae bacterium]|nr:hypothetical protein [Hyphomonadaceae bacterium]
MNLRLPAMIVGTAACLAPIVIAPDLVASNVLQAVSLAELEPRSLDSILTAAYVLAAALLPAICVISLARGWLAYIWGPRDRAVRRLYFWPLVGLVVAAILFSAQYVSARL